MRATTLPEELALLALNDESGVRESYFVDCALAGAALAPLATPETIAATS